MVKENKLLKRIITIALVACMTTVPVVDVSVRAIPSYEGSGNDSDKNLSSPTISIGKLSANVGDEVEVKISIKSNPGISSMKLSVAFDESKLTYVSSSINVEEMGGNAMLPQAESSPLILNWVSPTKDFNGDCEFATIKFKVSENASGTADISVTYNEDDIYNLAEENIKFEIENGAIEISSDSVPSEPVVSNSKVVIGNVSAKAGDEVEVKISLKDNPGISSMKLSVAFDESKLTYVSSSINVEEMGGNAMLPQAESSPLILNWVSPTKDFNGDCEFATIKFKVAKNASGTSDIKVTYNEDDIYNLAEENVKFEVENGAVEISNDSVPAESISVTPSSLALKVGDISKLTYTVSPENTTDTVKFTSSNTDVVTVDENTGEVKAIKAGTAEITATAGSVSSTPCKVTVAAEPVVSNSKVVIGNVSAKAGDEVEVKISLKDNPGISSMKLSVAFDENKLSYVSSSINIEEMGGNAMLPQAESSPLILNWVSPTKDFNGDCEFATIKFKVAKNASGTSDIKVTYNEDDIYNLAEENVKFEIENGAVEIEEKIHTHVLGKVE